VEPQTLGEFLAWTPNYPDAVLDKGLMYSGTKTILYGRYKSMKSVLLQKLCLAIANGEPWLGFNTPAGGLKVFYLQLEIPHPLLKKRMVKMTQGRDTVSELVVWTEMTLKLDNSQGLAKLEKQLTIYKPDVLVIDPLYKVMTGNITDNHDLTTLMDIVDVLISKYGVTVLLASHTRKSAIGKDGKEQAREGEGSDDLIGGVLLSAWADSIIYVKREKRKLTVNFDVVRHAEVELEPIVVDVTDDLDLIGTNEQLVIRI